MSRMPPRPRFTSRSVSPRRASSLSLAGLEVAQRPQVVGGERPATTGDGWRRRRRRRRARHRRRRPGLEQRLELPRLGPPVPVRLVRGERADERPVAALRAQVGVDAEAACATTSIRRRAIRSQLVRIALADEHHVDVAGVVQLAAAELAHADRRPAAARRHATRRRAAVEHVGGERRDRGDGDLDSGSRSSRSRAAIRSSSRSFQRTSSSTVAPRDWRPPVEGSRAPTPRRGASRRQRDSFRLAPVTATAAAASIGVVGEELGGVRLGDDAGARGRVGSPSVPPTARWPPRGRPRAKCGVCWSRPAPSGFLNSSRIRSGSDRIREEFGISAIPPPRSRPSAGPRWWELSSAAAGWGGGGGRG